MADHDTHDHTGVPGVGTAVADILDLPTAEMDDTLVLAPDGAGGVEFRAEAGGGGGVTKAYVGYNTVGGSTEAMTQKRLYATQITVGGSDVVLCSIEAYIAITAEAVSNYGYALFEDSGSNTIGDIIEHQPVTVSGNGMAQILAHGTGSYPARWYGGAMGRLLTASTKYWLGFYWFDGAAAPNLYYDGSGSDRYYAAGATPYIGDGQYSAFSQTNSTRKYSIRGLTIA